MAIKIIRYLDLVNAEGGKQIQQGMNFRIGGDYSVVLMSIAKNSPYDDELFDDGIIKYEGHDIFSKDTNLKKNTDQPMYNSSGTLTANGKFFNAVDDYKQGIAKAEKIKVYRKLRPGNWVDMGYYDLVNAKIESAEKRKVFKFFLKPIIDNDEPENIEETELEHQRYIPGKIMQEVFIRDKGKCILCGSEDNLHFDHKIPYSKGGTSIDAKNIQILCARHNLMKSNKLDY